MAHVKVVRRSTRPEEWTDLRFSWLERGIVRDREEITDLHIRDARQISENGYDDAPEGERPLVKGDMYFTPDGTVFIRGHATIPPRMHGENVYFSLKTAAEMIVKINGVYVGGVDPNRERFLLNPYIQGDELNIEIEAYNRSKPDDERNPASLSKRGCRQIFEGAYLETIRDNVQSLVYDYILFMDIAHCEYFNEDYRKFLFRELSRALDYVDFETWEGIDEAAAYVDRVIYRNTDFKGSGDVALVGHSHLDIAYYWRRIHAVQKNARTILIQLRLMDRYPEFRYTHTQAYTYETLEKYYPALFEELKEKYAAGQFEPVGAMYVEPDCNIPCAESLVRQFLYGQHFFRRAFGKTLDNAWLPDVFGNSWIMPQILKKSGVDYFVSNKMSTWNDTNRFPHNNFIWRGIDGSEVYACVPPTHFITWNMPSQIQENWEAYQDKETGGQTLSMYGYGDGGSGATEEMLEMIRRFPRVSVMPKTEVTGGADFLHKNLKDNPNLAVWDGELYLEMHRGTFTTKSEIKRMNRYLEGLLRLTEMVSVSRMLQGEAEYPAEEIRDVYKKLLLNQFHDILPGSHIHPVYLDAMADYRDIEARLKALLGDSRVYWNPQNFAFRGVRFVPDESGAFVRHGEKGAFQVTEAAPFDRVCFANGADDTAWFQMETKDGQTFVRTPRLSLQMNAQGAIDHLFMNGDEQDFVKTGRALNQLHLYADHPGVYDAWDILPNYRDVEEKLTLKEALHLTHVDGNCAEFESVFVTDKSEIRMYTRVFREDEAVETEYACKWHEKHRLLKVNFAPNILTRTLRCDTSAGYIDRELTKNTTWQEARFECCHHKWMDMSECGRGLAIINEGKYGVGLEGEEISLSLLRSTIRPDIESDMGEHDFCYQIVPHREDALKAGINARAIMFNTVLSPAPVALPAPLHRMLSQTSLVLQALKLSEDGKRVIVRLSEQNGSRGILKTEEKVEVLNLLEDRQDIQDTIPYHPFEILTLGIPLAQA